MTKQGAEKSSLSPFFGYKGLIRQVSIALFIVLAVYFALIGPLVRQGVNVLEEQIEEAVQALEGYIPKKGTGYLPKKEFLHTLQAQLTQQEENYQQLKNFLDPPKEYLPAGTEEAGLYFIEQLHITKKRLRRQAHSLKIKIPESFGFSEEMPQDAQDVEILLKELDIVERLTTLLMEQGVEEISLVKPLEPIEQRDHQSQQLFFQELPFQLSFLCTSPTLVKFLYQIKNFSPALIIKEIIIRRQEKATLQVEMLLSRLVI